MAIWITEMHLHATNTFLKPSDQVTTTKWLEAVFFRLLSHAFKQQRELKSKGMLISMHLQSQHQDLKLTKLKVKTLNWTCWWIRTLRLQNFTGILFIQFKLKRSLIMITWSGSMIDLISSKKRTILSEDQSPDLTYRILITWRKKKFYQQKCQI